MLLQTAQWLRSSGRDAAKPRQDNHPTDLTEPDASLAASGPVTIAAGSTMGAPIWEREGTLGSIERLLDGARSGHGGSLFIIGEAGLGKTTMVERARELAGAGFRIGVGRGDAAESTLPFGILDQALRSLGLRDELEGGGGTAKRGLDARATRFYAVLRFLESLADNPTLLILDDLHWADEDSLALLSFLCRRTGGLPLVMLATVRPWPKAALETATRLAQGGDAILERLQPLSEEAAALLLGDRTGRAVSPSSVRRAGRLTGGNPLLLEQVAIEIRQGKSLPDVEQVATGHFEKQLLLSRFAGVSGNERQYAQAASVLGSRFRPAVVCEIAGLSSADGDKALEALCQSGLFRAATGSSAEFAHPLLAQVLYDDVAAPVRARRHATAFRVLVSRGADPAEAAEHAMRGDLAGDPEAVAVLEQAGQAAMAAGAISTARQRFSAAVDLAGARASAGLLMDLGEALLDSGDSDAAVTTYRRVLGMTDLTGSRRLQAQRMLGRALFTSGDVPAARAQFAAVIEPAAGSDVSQAVEALLDQAFVSWPTGGPALAMPLVVKARALAGQTTPGLQKRAETAWAFTAFVSGDPAGIPVVDAAVQMAYANPLADTGDFAWSWGTLGTYGNIAKWTERWDDATRAYQVGMTTAERLGLPIAIAAMAVMHADTCVRTGRLHEAIELVDRATSLADLAPERAFWAAIAHAYILADMGRMEECAAWWRNAESLATDAEDWAGKIWLWHIEAVLEMHARQTAAACALFERIEALAQRLQVVEPCVVPWAGDAITSYLYALRMDDALRIIASLEQASQALPCRYPRIVVAGSRAAIAQLQGDRDASARFLEETVELATGSGMPVLLARVLIRYGGFLRRGGEAKRAQPLLIQAVELAEAAGAESVAAKAAEEFAAAEGRRRRRHVSPDELTPQERRVKALAGEGLSNQQIARRLFVSVDTVETHLQHIYGKLNVTRKDLIREHARALSTPVAVAPAAIAGPPGTRGA